MISIKIKDYLTDKLGVPVYMEIPTVAPEQFLILEVKGMGREDYLYSSLAMIQSYAGSRHAAAQLNERVKTAMYGLTKMSEVSRCELNSDYDFTNTAAKQYRWQAVFDIMHY